MHTASGGRATSDGELPPSWHHHHQYMTQKRAGFSHVKSDLRSMARSKQFPLESSPKGVQCGAVNLLRPTAMQLVHAAKHYVDHSTLTLTSSS